MTALRADHIRSLLEAEIIARQLMPGERLDEKRLSERFQTSRTPIREALCLLAASGLVEITANKGAVVSRLNSKGLADLVDVLAELEGACGRLAAQLRLRTDIDDIQMAYEDCVAQEREGDSLTYAGANRAFHEAIYRASNNSLLIRTTRSIINRVSFYIQKSFEGTCRLSISVAEHKSILDAIAAGNAEEADRLLREHIQNDQLNKLYEKTRAGENGDRPNQ